MTWFKAKPKNALVIVPEQQELMQRTASIDPNGNSAVHQAMSQQVGSLGPNQSFEVEHSVTPTGAKIRFSKTTHPATVAPMQVANDDMQDRLRLMELDLRILREVAARTTHSQRPENLEVNGIPCVLQKSGNGYDLMRVRPDGSLELYCRLGVKP